MRETDSGVVGGGGDEDPVTQGPGEDTSPSAPRCAELSAQGLMCHDGWCWDLGGHQDARNGWAVGSYGTVLRYAGGAWAQCTYGTTSEPTLYGVSTSADGVTWAVGTSAHRRTLLP